MIFDSPANLSGQSRATRTCPPWPKPRRRAGAAVDGDDARVVRAHEDARRARATRRRACGITPRAHAAAVVLVGQRVIRARPSGRATQRSRPVAGSSATMRLNGVQKTSKPSTTIGVVCVELLAIRSRRDASARRSSSARRPRGRRRCSCRSAAPPNSACRPTCRRNSPSRVVGRQPPGSACGSADGATEPDARIASDPARAERRFMNSMIGCRRGTPSPPAPWRRGTARPGASSAPPCP